LTAESQILNVELVLNLIADLKEIKRFLSYDLIILQAVANKCITTKSKNMAIPKHSQRLCDA
jgi:hypothetical protein